ncbi:MAG: PAS domain S-box protein [Acidobacteriia bacterium]|nr:PAS domain S-box protein [Terriglobia bacterium]
MGWLVLGVLYSAAYAGVGWLLRDQPVVLSWFRAVALLVPPITGAVVIVRRRHTWAGCQWLFWSTIALGLAMSAIGLTGWAADELVLGHGTWLAWPSVFALFGSVAPLFALLAQPHRGPREPLAATTAVDIAGLAVVTGFLYSFFVTAPSSSPLLIVSELQQALVVLAMAAAMVAARHTPWRATYRRLALGALVSFVTLTMSNVEAQQGIYRAAFVYDFTWILPFAFFPWAATKAPESETGEAAAGEEELTRPRPWVIFTAVALLPFLDFALRHVAPDEANQSFRDLSTAIAIVSVLPLLVARIAAERAELQQAGSTMKLLAQVIEQAQDLILVLTPDGRCRHANSAFCRAMGLSPDELTGLSGRDLMARDGISADDIQSVVRAGGTWRGTVTRTRRDGTTFTSSATVAALLDDRGEPTHIVSVERDISEERRLREQLIHSERLSAVGQLVAGVAHELNNPLQGLMGLTELLIGAETRPEIRRDLEMVRHDGERAATIVKNLLAFARRSALERSVADLNEIGRSSLALRAYELKLAGTIVGAEYADDLPMLVVNREEIQQIVLNLIMNAEHALRSAGRPGTITLRTALDGELVCLEVSDDGPGVPPELVGRIFEPFFTTKGVGEGTGLGLSVSLGIAQAHNGSLTLLPSARGARFALTLPASEPHQAVMAASKMDASSSGPA